MTYNTTRPKLILPEYGRSIQIMVEYVKTLETKAERNLAANDVIELMGQLNPHLRDVNDFKHKLWDHLFQIAEFDLDVDSPFAIPTPQTVFTKPKQLTYRKQAIKYRHYGRIIGEMVKEIVSMEEGNDKEIFTSQVANFMKVSYQNWNKTNVNDADILADLHQLSQGKIDTQNIVLTQDVVGSRGDNVDRLNTKMKTHTPNNNQNRHHNHNNQKNNNNQPRNRNNNQK